MPRFSLSVSSSSRRKGGGDQLKTENQGLGLVSEAQGPVRSLQGGLGGLGRGSGLGEIKHGFISPGLTLERLDELETGPVKLHPGFLPQMLGTSSQMARS